MKYENLQIYYSSLIKEIGLIRLEKGKTVKDSLEIDGISLWDIFSSELAWRHLTTAFSKKREINLKIYLKSIIIRVRNFFLIHLFFKYNNKRSFSRLYEHDILCMAQTPNMFKEVIEPICKYLSLNYQFKNIALTENRKLAFNFRNSVNDIDIINIWDFWNNETKAFSKDISKKLKVLRNNFLESKNIDIYLKKKNVETRKTLKLIFNLFFNYLTVEMIPRFAIAKFMINAHKPKIMLSPDISDSRIRVFNLICKKKMVPTLNIQFGLAGKEAIEWRFAQSDFYSVWGESSKKTLINHGIQKNKIFITGSAKHDLLIKENKKSISLTKQRFKLQEKKILVLLASTYEDKAHEKFAQNQILKNMKSSIFKNLQKVSNVHLLVKPHPHENIDETKSLIKNKKNNIMILHKNEDIRELIRICDIFISFASSSMIDALIAKKLCICPMFSGWPFSNGYVESKTVLIPKNDEDVKKIFRSISVKKINNLKESLQKKRMKFLNKISSNSNGDAEKKISNLILKIISKSNLNYD